MTRLIRSAWVVARRDYVATVMSRTFLIFLVAPLLSILFAGGISAVEGRKHDAAAPPLAVRADAATLRLLDDARTRIAARLGADWLPPLLADGTLPGGAVLTGPLDRPGLTGPAAAVDALRGPAALLVDEALALRAGVPPPVRLALHPIAPARPDDQAARHGVAQAAQFVMFLLTLVLAGMLIFNLVEEKSSKVIEVLAAAVPVDAIFAGKLVGMLGVSLTAILIWGSAAGIGAAALLRHVAVGAPAVGWPAFIALAVAYWIMLYLLVGALYLGIGAQAASVREVQTISLPLTFAQVVFFLLGAATLDRPGGPLAIVATVLPWSSPFAMAANAAREPALWPHPLALAWQFACLALVVRTAARLFRRTVLKSGGAPASQSRRRFLFRAGRSDDR